MWYIVYREKFKSYTETGGGYFVKYKNKIEDSYSPNWFEAQKYKSLGSALNRMGIILELGMDDLDKFFKANSIDNRAMKRDTILSDILGEERDNNALIFSKGRIDKVGSDGRFLGSAEDEVMEYITSYLAKNKISNDRKMKAINDIIKNVSGDTNGYIIETKEGEDFWEGF